jgi:hypothetical protein
MDGQLIQGARFGKDKAQPCQPAGVVIRPPMTQARAWVSDYRRSDSDTSTSRHDRVFTTLMSLAGTHRWSR